MLSLDTSVEVLVLIFVVFVISGFVKGVIGLGLPSVSLALLAATLGLKPAMAILVLPALLTNVVQALTGSGLKAILKRMWLYIIIAFVCTWFGAGVLAGVNSPWLAALLGILLAAYGGLSLTTRQVNLSPRYEPVAAPVVGGISGAFTGLTGSFVVPSVMYLQALGLPRDHFIQAMGILFTMASLALGLGLGGHGLLPTSLLILSGLSLIPAFAGMWLGTAVRKRMNDQVFRKVFFVSLILLGLYIIVRAFILGEV